MTPSEFVNEYEASARNIAARTGVPVLVMLAQAALESGWGKSAPRFNFFGVKATGWSGDKQLLTTTEYGKEKIPPVGKFPEFISSTFDAASGKWKYKVKAYFRAYNSAEQSFEDYAALLNRVYKTAFKFSDPYDFAAEVAKKYATSPTYREKVWTVMNIIAPLIGEKKRVS